MIKKLSALVLLVFSAFIVHAQSELKNKIAVSATPTVTYDPNTGLFTYSYLLVSGPQSVQEVDTFFVPLRGTTALNVRSPTGWTGTINASNGGIVAWCSCAEEGILAPANFVDKGQLVPSIYQIKPGHSLVGFSFQSPDPPSAGIFYASGFVQIPIEGIDFAPGMSPNLATYPNDRFSGQVDSPLRIEIPFAGGRRPAVDAFTTFLTLKDGDSKQAPVLIDLVFGPNGETVYADTFRAVLNGVDITNQFLALSAVRRRAYLQVVSGGVLKTGANVLTTSVDGMVPGATRTATDTDRLKFVVQ